MKTVSNRQLTLLRKLNRKKYREQEQLFLLEGARAVEQVLENDMVGVEALFFDSSQRFWEEENWEKYSRQFQSATINEGHFREVSDTDNPQGILALCRMPGELETDELAGQEGIILAADRIQDPGNLGTMIRTAAWFGARGLLAGKGTVDLFHPKVVRSTAGATGSLGYKNAELETELPAFEARGWEVLILDGGIDSLDIREVDPPAKALLLVGNEANGVAQELTEAGRKKVRIIATAGKRHVESLNAAMAAGIALFALNK